MSAMPIIKLPGAATTRTPIAFLDSVTVGEIGHPVISASVGLVKQLTKPSSSASVGQPEAWSTRTSAWRWRILLSESAAEAPRPPATQRVSIDYFPNEPYRLLKSILVRIQLIGEGDFLASFDEANLAMSGDTAQEALQNLAAHVLDVFELLSEEEGALGPGPTEQLRILRTYLAPQGR